MNAWGQSNMKITHGTQVINNGSAAQTKRAAGHHNSDAFQEDQLQELRIHRVLDSLQDDGVLMHHKDGSEIAELGIVEQGDAVNEVLEGVMPLPCHQKLESARADS